MSDFFFSIIIPAYNRALMLPDTICSVINQTNTNWELIIIDDASTDNTKEVVAAFNDSRIKYLKNDINIERSASRNRGIDAALGKYICFLDSDDLWKQNHLEVIYNYLSENNFPEVFLFTAYTWNFQDKPAKDVFLPDLQSDNLVEYFIEYQPATPAVCVAKSIFNKFKFNEKLNINEDVDLYSRIVSKYPVVKINSLTVDVIVHSGNTKGVFKDYITPQIMVFKLLCTQPETAPFISKKFKNNRFKLLHSWLLKYLEETDDAIKFRNELFKFLLKYPFAQGNKARFVSLLYSLPLFGNFCKKIIRSLKK